MAILEKPKLKLIGDAEFEYIYANKNNFKTREQVLKFGELVFLKHIKFLLDYAAYGRLPSDDDLNYRKYNKPSKPETYVNALNETIEKVKKYINHVLGK